MTTYMNDDGVREMELAIADGRGDEPVTLRQQVNTTIGAHALVDRIALQLRAAGLRVDVQSAGGWFSKDHLITVEGPIRKVYRAQSWMANIQ